MKSLLISLVVALMSSACVGAPPPTVGPEVVTPTVQTELEPTNTSNAASWTARGALIGVDRGLIYVGGRQLSAFASDCVAACQPVLSSRVTAQGTLIAAGEHVYVPTASGVSILERGCRGTCSPIGTLRFDTSQHPLTRRLGWEANSFLPVASTSSDVLVQVGWDGAAGSGIYPSLLTTFPIDCSRGCRPSWVSEVANGRRVPLVDGDTTYAPRLDGIDAYQGCEGTCSPRWRGRTGPEPGGMWTGTAVIDEGLVITTTSGCVCGADGTTPYLSAFPRGCTDETCEPRWWAPLEGHRFTTEPVVTNGRVFVFSDGWRDPAGASYPIDCRGDCAPAARYRTPGEFARTPIVLGDSIYLQVTGPNRLLRLDTGCVGLCRPTAVASLHGSASAAGAVATDDGVAVAAGSVLSLFTTPADVGWTADWTWDAGARIETFHIAHEIAIVSTHRHVYAVALPT